MDLKRFSVIGRLGIGLLGVFGFNAAASDWPEYRGADNGVSTEAVKIEVPAGGLKPIWKAQTPNGFSSFAVGEGKAFTLVLQPVDGSPNEVCIALDANSGKELWNAPIGPAKYQGGGDSGAEGNKGGDGPRSTPAVHAGRVFVYSSGMVLCCLDAATGKPIWKKDVIRDFAGSNIQWSSAMSPVLDAGRVIIAGGGPGKSMLALDENTGAVIWQTGDEKITHSTPAIATIDGVRQVIFFMQSGLVAVNAQDGKELWRYAFPYKVSTALTPVVGGNIVFCSAGYDVGSAACEITKTGSKYHAKELWRIHGNKDVVAQWSTPVLKDGYLYGMFSAKKFATGPMKCVELKTGQLKWEKEGFGVGNVILTGNTLLALADDGRVVVVEATPAAYKELGRFKAVSGKCWSTPALSDGKLYVRSTKEAACFVLRKS